MNERMRRYQKLNKIELWNTSHLSNMQKKEVENLLNQGSPQILNSFIIHDGRHSEIKDYFPGLAKILSNAQDEVTIDTFNIDEESLKSIIEASYLWKTLKIVGCTVEITNQFSLDWDLNYKIRNLDLSMTAVCKDLRT